MESKKYLILTYGCQMNVHESEKLAGILESEGFSPVSDATQANIVVLNTCAIRENAEHKIFGNIGELKNIKIARPDMIIAVGGCMSQQKNYADEIMKRFPYVDIVFGTHNLAEFDNFLKQTIKTRKKVVEITENETIALRDELKMSRTSGVNAWVNIMYGCNNWCTYCIVPYVRGREHSRPVADIIKEVNGLLEEGYRQITLLGQNVNSYRGVDESRKEVNFAGLLAEIDKLGGDFYLRFMTSHPRDLSSEVINVIAASEHICHGIHLPVQSGSNAVLKSMNRHYTVEKYLGLVDEIKTKIPDAELTTDIIVGFPGETEEDFEETLKVLEYVKYMQIFAFCYSKRKGTPAEKMPAQIERSVKQERLSRLIKLKNEIINKKSSAMLGTTAEALIESYDSEKKILYGSLGSGKTIILAGDESLVGEFALVKVTKVNKSVIYGEVIEIKKTQNPVKKMYKMPQNVSILPKIENSMKVLRENKQSAKRQKNNKK